jgi:hypothetical protein
MNFEDLLTKEQSNPTSKILEFLIKYEEQSIIALVEGEDDITFYYDFIPEYTASSSRDIMFFSCGGKRQAANLKNYLSAYQLANKPRILLLLDSDFDRYTGVTYENAHQTHYYSIESYFCTPKYVEYVLRKHVSGRISNKEIITITQEVENKFSEARRHFLVPMAAMCALRKLESDVSLDEINCMELIEVRCGNIKRRADRNILKSAIKERNISWKEIRQYAVLFKNDDTLKWFRGKQCLQLIRVLLKLACEYRSYTTSFGKVSGAFGTDAFKTAKAFLGDLPSLKEFCAAATSA